MLGWRKKVAALTATPMLAASLVAAPVVVGAQAGAASAAAVDRPNRYEDRVVYWTNVKRKRHGLRPLRKKPCPDRHAERWGAHLAKTERFYHQDVTKMFRCHRVNRAGENLVRGRVRPRKAVNLWMRSPGHRKNILNPRYTHIGVGSYRSTGDGRTYTSQTFTGPR